MRRRTIHRLAAFALAVAATTLAACAIQPSAPGAIPATAGTGIALLGARERDLTALQTPAVMEYAGPGGHFKAREMITVRRPSSLRVEALTPLGVAMVIAASPTEIAVFDPAKNTIARGAATAATLEQVARIPLAPAQAVSLMLAILPDGDALNSPNAITSGADQTLLTYRRADGNSDQVAFSDGDLASVREGAVDGTVLYEVKYSDYRDIGGMRFPHVVEASFPAAATTLKLTYERPLIDGAIPDTAFVLAPGPQTRELRLGLESEPDLRG
jgi:hypothetical protein